MAYLFIMSKCGNRPSDNPSIIINLIEAELEEQIQVCRITSINSRTPKMCYPQKEGNVTPILF